MDIPSPAVAIVGRRNSGKTTLIERLIRELAKRGYDVASVKHHHQVGFDIDIPGKDSYRHRQAGASETVIAAPDQLARVTTLERELECSEIVRTMPGHDIVLVEGYRKSGIPVIEIMRAANEADGEAAEAFLQDALDGVALGADYAQRSREDRLRVPSPEKHCPTTPLIGVVSDIPAALEAARVYGIPSFGIDDANAIADYLETAVMLPKLTVAIQAGGESKRMKQDKALVPFAGRPMICRAIDRLSPIADELIITTNEADKFAFLSHDYPDLNIRLVPDLHDYRGALPGIHTALAAATNPHVAIVACDMVFASPRLVVAEALVLNESGADVVIPVNKYGYEPFHALYRRSSCLSVMDDLLAQGHRQVRALCECVRVREFTQAEVLEAEPLGGCFVNVNTPEDLRWFEKQVFEWQ